MKRLTSRRLALTLNPTAPEPSPSVNLSRILTADQWSAAEIQAWTSLYRRRLHSPYEAYYALLDGYTTLSLYLLQRAQAIEGGVELVTSSLHSYLDSLPINATPPTELDLLNCRQLHTLELAAQAQEIRNLTTEVTVKDGAVCTRPSCRSTNTICVLVRMNGSDEPMTNMFRCYTCNNSWRN